MTCPTGADHIPWTEGSNELTTLELLAGLGGNPAEAGGDNGISGDVGNGLFSDEMPSPSVGVALYLKGEVDSRPADFMAASSSCLDGRSIGALRCGEGFACACRLHIAAAPLTDGVPLTFSLSSSTGPAFRRPFVPDLVESALGLDRTADVFGADG